MKGRIQLVSGVNFRVTSGSGHTSCTDGPPEHGGQNAGMRPMEMLLLGMGGCTAYDVVEILRKRRRELDLLEIEIQAERADEIPKVFTKIHLKYTVKGAGVKTAEVARAIELSLDKYCSATRMLAKTAEITHEFSLLDETNSSPA